MILFKLLKAIVLYIRYTEYKFITKSTCVSCLRQTTHVPLRYRSTTLFIENTSIYTVYKAIKNARSTIADLYDIQH